MIEFDGYTEAYDALRSERIEKRQKNTAAPTQILKDRGIEFKSYNKGAHLVIEDFDLWPSTGLFIHRITAKRGRGVFNLIKLLKQKGN